MEKQRSNFRVVLFAAVLLFLIGAFAATASAADGVVLFAPATAEHFGDTSYHQQAAKQIDQRLRKAGIPGKRLVSLSGKAATAEAFRDALVDMVDSTGSDDLLLVVICSPGLQFDDHDYVLAADTPKDPTSEIGEEDGKLISIIDVLEEMTISASQRRVLIVDGASESETTLSNATARFGRRPLETADGQWVILNRSKHLGKRGDTPPITDFAWSLLDGMAFHADGNRDGTVSVLELADYMKLYAEEQNNPVPKIAGKTSGDVVLVSTSTAEDDSFPREALATNARRLVTEARKTLLLELDVRAGMGLLDRAKRLCADPGLEHEIEQVAVTAGILRGEADRVLPESKEEETSYLAVLPREAGVYAAGAAKPSQHLPAGTVVQVTHRAVSTAEGRSSTYISANGALLPEWKTDEVSFTSIPLPGDAVWMLAKDFIVASDEPTVPAMTLREQFLKPAAVAEESPATAEAQESP